MKGVWDLEICLKFNILLLAKQGWRRLQNPTSLSARLIRSKYYRGSNFLGANLGSNPSMVWQSIWSSKDLLKLGLRWRIGTRHSVSIREDCWLPGDTNNLVRSNPVLGIDRVSDLRIRWNDNLKKKKCLQ